MYAGQNLDLSPWCLTHPALHPFAFQNFFFYMKHFQHFKEPHNWSVSDWSIIITTVLFMMRFTKSPSNQINPAKT